MLGINADNIVCIKDNNNVSSDEGFGKVIKSVNIGACNKNRLEKQESRIIDWVRMLDMPEGKTNGQDAIE